jgi:hypothetical protein
MACAAVPRRVRYVQQQDEEEANVDRHERGGYIAEAAKLLHDGGSGPPFFPFGVVPARLSIALSDGGCRAHACMGCLVQYNMTTSPRRSEHPPTKVASLRVLDMCVP